jgi:rhodanese-related sulfurtransferase
VNDACVLLGKPNAYGAIFQFEGQASVFAAPGGPCYRCLFPEPPPPGLVPSCAEAGVFGVLPGVIGAIQATEAIKLVLGIGDPLVGRLVTYDALRLAFREVTLRRDPACPVCGTNPTIRGLIDYDTFCGTSASDSTMACDPISVLGSDSIAGGQAREAAGDMDIRITCAELKARLARGERPFILDVREPFEFAIGALPGATLLPLGELRSRRQELDPAHEIVVYCHHGIRSADATSYLRQQGYRHARNLHGGIDEWSLSVDPSVARY